LERFHEHHSDVEVRLFAMRTSEKVRALLEGELDAALMRAADKIEGLDLLNSGASVSWRCCRVDIRWPGLTGFRSASSRCIR
jgi:hypothetical protein